VPFRSSAPSKTGGVGWLTRKWTVSFLIRIGTSQWLFDESRNTSSSSGEYQLSPVAGSMGRRAPGMSLQRKRWKVRTPSGSIG
jgi:hypothetical protein